MVRARTAPISSSACERSDALRYPSDTLSINKVSSSARLPAREGQRARELGRGATAWPFGDVRGHRHRSTTQLVREGESLISAGRRCTRRYTTGTSSMAFCQTIRSRNPRGGPLRGPEPLSGDPLPPRSGGPPRSSEYDRPAPDCRRPPPDDPCDALPIGELPPQWWVGSGQPGWHQFSVFGSARGSASGAAAPRPAGRSGRAAGPGCSARRRSAGLRRDGALVVGAAPASRLSRSSSARARL